MWLHWGAGQLIHTPTAAKWLTWATLGRPYKMAFNPNTQIQTIRGWLTQHDIKHLWHIKNQSQRNCQKWKSLSQRKDTQSHKKTKMKRKNKNQKKKIESKCNDISSPAGWFDLHSWRQLQEKGTYLAHFMFYCCHIHKPFTRNFSMGQNCNDFVKWNSVKQRKTKTAVKNSIRYICTHTDTSSYRYKYIRQVNTTKDATTTKWLWLTRSIHDAKSKHAFL